jgi:hypothetical protein
MDIPQSFSIVLRAILNSEIMNQQHRMGKNPRLQSPWKALAYSMKAETRRQSALNDFNFSPFCACSQMTAKCTRSVEWTSNLEFSKCMSSTFSPEPPFVRAVPSTICPFTTLKFHLGYSGHTEPSHDFHTGRAVWPVFFLEGYNMEMTMSSRSRTKCRPQLAQP